MIIGLHLVYNITLDIEKNLTNEEKILFNKTLEKFHIDTIQKFEIEESSDKK